MSASQQARSASLALLLWLCLLCCTSAANSSSSAVRPLLHLQRLQQWTVSIPVDVLLVGFDGDGEAAVRLSPASLLRHLQASAAVASDRYRQLEPAARGSLDPSFLIRYAFHVSHAPAAVLSSVVSSLHPLLDSEHRRRAVNASSGSAASHLSYDPASVAAIHVPVPAALVTAALSQERAASLSSSSAARYGLYLLNLPTLRLPSTAAVKYQYFLSAAASPVCYTQHSLSLSPPPIASPGSPPPPPPASFAWLDLSSGPVTYGPHTLGDGVVTEFSLPRPARAFASVAPLTAAQTQRRTASLSAQLAALVHRTASALFAGGAQRWTAAGEEAIALNFIFIHEAAGAAASAAGETSQRRSEEEQWAMYSDPAVRSARDTADAWAAVASALSAVSPVPLSVASHHLHFSSCELCAAAFTHSLRSASSSAQSPLLALDAEELRDWLEHFDARFWGIRNGSRADGDSRRVVNAFVYDLQTADAVLLTDGQQAAGWPDMVLGVISSRAAPLLRDVSCNGAMLQLQPGDAAPAVLAALLSALFGLPSSPALSVSPVSGRQQPDHLWDIGTPWSPFSPVPLSSQLLPFPLHIAPRRLHVLSRISSTLSPLLSLLSRLHELQLPYSALFSAAALSAFIQRQAQLVSQVERALEALSRDSWSEAQQAVSAAGEQVQALLQAAGGQVRSVRGKLSCGVQTVREGRRERRPQGWTDGWLVRGLLWSGELLLLLSALALSFCCLRLLGDGGRGGRVSQLGAEAAWADGAAGLQQRLYSAFLSFADFTEGRAAAQSQQRHLGSGGTAALIQV